MGADGIPPHHSLTGDEPLPYYLSGHGLVRDPLTVHALVNPTTIPKDHRPTLPKGDAGDFPPAAEAEGIQNGTRSHPLWL
jgi:hypothetical protein